MTDVWLVLSYTYYESTGFTDGGGVFDSEEAAVAYVTGLGAVKAKCQHDPDSLDYQMTDVRTVDGFHITRTQLNTAFPFK